MSTAWRRARGCFIKKVHLLGEVVRPKERYRKEQPIDGCYDQELAKVPSDWNMEESILEIQ